jgi:hypothetical protein
MRNLIEHPVTVPDVYDTLQIIIQADLNKPVGQMPIGSMKPLILSIVVDFIKKNEDAFTEYLKVVAERSATPS